jgi:hypothetical protein
MKEVFDLFDKERDIRGIEVYRYLSKILKQVKERHKQDFLTTGKKTDHEQA